MSGSSSSRYHSFIREAEVQKYTSMYLVLSKPSHTDTQIKGPLPTRNVGFWEVLRDPPLVHLKLQSIHFIYVSWDPEDKKQQQHNSFTLDDHQRAF